jgi:hypothetical protein
MLARIGVMQALNRHVDRNLVPEVSPNHGMIDPAARCDLVPLSRT